MESRDHSQGALFAQRLLSLEREILKVLAREPDGGRVREALCAHVEALVPKSVAMLMQLDPRRCTLSLVASSSRQEELKSFLTDLAPTAGLGSCPTAAATRAPVLVGDTETDERWAQARHVARQLGIRACWSIPLFGIEDRLLGSFAISRAKPGLPDAATLRLLETAARLGEVALSMEDRSRELAESRALLQGVIEATEDPIFAKDRGGKYVLANTAEVEGLLPSPEAIVGKTDAELYGETQARISAGYDRRVLERGESVVYEHEFVNPKQGRRVFQIRKSPLRDAEGHISGLVGVARDVTERERHEEALRRTQKLESLGVLAGGVAHDFNNILTGILGNAEVALAEVPAGGALGEALREIRRSALRAAELTHQMLAYAGRSSAERVMLDVPTLWEDVQRLVATSISKRARLLVEHADDLPRIEGDPAQLRQVLMNLLTNASDALGDREGEIRVCIDRVWLDPAEAPEGKGGCFVRLTVTDEGCGMDAATRERMFGPFFTTKFAGRGLGLAAVRGIVLGHGGTIDVESVPGEGTQVTVLLPASERRDADAAPTPAPKSPPRANDVDARGAVLVVEDEEPVRSLIARVLARGGLEIEFAEDGAVAVERFERDPGRYDLVLLDLTTPRLEGPEVARRLLARRPGLPIVLMSGFGEEEARAGFPAGAITDFLPKPFRTAELRRLVLSHLPRR